jgi:DNA-binding NarL/FixJ family response regulator
VNLGNKILNKMKQRLSPREKQIAIYLFNGKSVKYIATSLNLKANTISTFKKKIFLKLQVDSLISLFKKINENSLFIE